MMEQPKEPGAQAGPQTNRIVGEDDIALGRRIHQVRTEHGLKRGPFAARLDVTSHAIVRWEKGYGVKRDNLRRIAVEFDVSFDWLTTGEGMPRSTGKIMERIAALPPHEAMQFVEEIEALLKLKEARAKTPKT